LNEQGNDTVCVKNGNETKRHIVIFDGKCGFCRASVHFLKKLDWLGKLEFVSLTDPRALAIAPGVTKEDFEKAVYCVSNKGKITSAARCFRFMAIRVPLLFPLGLLLWFPGMIWIAEKIYEWIANHRSLLSRIFGIHGEGSP
jgi:predicted DCC family thiol-disulfide oxidoreductase YuxK